MKALVVDDDRVLADLVSFTLRREGFTAVHAGDAAGALRLLEQESPDLIILDINLPGTRDLKDGFDLCRHIRAGSEVPILLLTVRGEEQDIVHGLEVGADDYILKPFSPRQLLARVQAVMRRAKTAGASHPPARLAHEGLELDTKMRQVRLADGGIRRLTPLETRLLEALLLNAGQVLTSDDLISDVWGAGGGSTEMLRQLVRRLRAKIESDP
ncbi:MAG TPA: response regulator transcription factor, partial [Anaerolineales bacterium]